MFFQVAFISFLHLISGKLLGDKFHAISIRFYRRRKIIYPQINRYRPFFHPFLGVKGGKLASNTPKVYLLTSSHIGSLCVCKLEAGRTMKIMALNSWIFPSKASHVTLAEVRSVRRFHKSVVVVSVDRNGEVKCLGWVLGWRHHSESPGLKLETF